MKTLLPIVLGLSMLLAGFAYAQEEEADPADVALGERLFLETRFAEFFARNAGGDVNGPLANGGDPVVATTDSPTGPLAGPFAGLSMNCRSCHLVDEQLRFGGNGAPDLQLGGIRTYADFARRSPVPRREDGATRAPRNSPALVNASLSRKGGVQLHFDGEFTSLRDLARETLLGRNYGWLPGERGQAIAHIARVIREDDGQGPLASAFGGSYARVLRGSDAGIPKAFVLPKPMRLDVRKASDAKIVGAVARLIERYVEQLEFARGDDGAFVGSPYDLFVLRNGLPRQPRATESPRDYSQRLAVALDGLQAPRFVADVDGPFVLHDQRFEFGPEELEGLRVFLRRPSAARSTPDGVGNCAACHPAPLFTDFLFRNTGVSQLEYDGVHGDGAFAALEIPSRARRAANPDAFLPATPKHPHASGRFRAAASATNPELVDLGAWNVLGNADFPLAQVPLKRALLLSLGARNLANDALLAAATARFKTPGLRDLGHSGPYMHNGEFDTLDSVIELYRTTADLQRGGRLRNGAPELAGVHLSSGDVATLAAFLLALNEDYN